MNDDIKNSLQKAIMACAKKAAQANNAVEALQFTQASLNAANALTGLHLNMNTKSVQ